MSKIPKNQRMYDLDKKLVKVKSYTSPFLPYIIQKPAWNFLQGIRTVVTKKMYRKMLKLLVENNPISYQSRYPDFKDWMPKFDISTDIKRPKDTMWKCTTCGVIYPIIETHWCLGKIN